MRSWQLNGLRVHSMREPCHNPDKQMGYQQYQYLKGRAWAVRQAQAQCSCFYIELIFTIYNKTEVDTPDLNFTCAIRCEIFFTFMVKISKFALNM